MADEPVVAPVQPAAQSSSPPAAVTPAVDAASSPASVDVAPPPVSSPAPAAAEATSTPAATPEPTAAPAEAPKPAEAAPPPSLLSEAGKAAEAPKSDAKAPEAKPAEAAPLPTYEPFKAPEGFTLDAEPLANFQKSLGELEVATKADHATLQTFGQKAIDMYVSEIQRAQKAQADLWQKTREGWINQFDADKDIGGNRRETSLMRAGFIIEKFGGNAKQIAELRNIFAITGAGDHPAVIRLLANVGNALQEGKPVPAQIAPKPATKGARRYTTPLMNGNATGA